MAGENKVDDTILRYADTRSPEEISEMLGGIISPARVAAHTKALLKSRDWLEQADLEALTFHKLRALLADLEGQYQTLDHTKVQLGIIKAIFGRMDTLQARTTTDLEHYNANVGRIMGRVVDMALSYMKGALREEVDAARWDELVLEALTQARAEIAKHEIED